MASIGDVPVIYREGYTPTVARPSGGWGGRLDDCELIEVVKLTGTSSKDPLDLSYPTTSALQKDDDTFSNIPPMVYLFKEDIAPGYMSCAVLSYKLRG